MPRRVTRSTSCPNISFNSDSMSSSSNKLCPAPSAKLTSTSTSLPGPKSSRNTDPKSASSIICQRRQKSRSFSGGTARESFNDAPSTAGFRFRCRHRFPTGMIPGCSSDPRPGRSSGDEAVRARRLRSPVAAWSCARSSFASSVTSSARSRARLLSSSARKPVRYRGSFASSGRPSRGSRSSSPRGFTGHGARTLDAGPRESPCSLTSAPPPYGHSDGSIQDPGRGARVLDRRLRRPGPDRAA